MIKIFNYSIGSEIYCMLYSNFYSKKIEGGRNGGLLRVFEQFTIINKKW